MLRRVAVVLACVTSLALGVRADPGAAPAPAAIDPVRIDSGLVAGASARDGVRVYQGIPFAAPPVGPLRWRPPQPVKPWDRVRPCTEPGPSCPQPKPMVGPPPAWSDEDCLNLNVWTAAPPDGPKRPVMVWIHGGGFTTGTGSYALYDGAALARQGVVVVTINYRLGPFGFFAHPLLSKESERGVSGNYGLLDQIAALEWVKRNIAAFGGDPGCVTIFGESAGSVSVCDLLVSPLAAGLFHRAIAESGGVHGRIRGLRDRRSGMEPAEQMGERVARALGCDRADDPLAALRAKGADELLAAAHPSQGLYGKAEDKFWPVVDGWVLPDDPAALFDAGKRHDVPFMIGTNADENTIFLRQLPVRHAEGYRLLLRAFFRADAGAVEVLFPAATDEEVGAALNRCMTVASFVTPARALARAQEKVKSPAWLYHFTRIPPVARPLKLGAFHSAEIAYVFGNLDDGPVASREEVDRALARTLGGYWTRFAATGDPNRDGLPAWPAYTRADDQHLDLGDAVKVGQGLWREACDLFERIHAAHAKDRDE